MDCIEPVQGQRTIIRHVDKYDGRRSYQGKIDPVRPKDQHLREKEWWERSQENVVRDMNKDLGEIPDTEYEVIE